MNEIVLRKYLDEDEVALKNIIKDANCNYVKDLNDCNRNDLTIAEYKGVIKGYLYASM